MGAFLTQGHAHFSSGCGFIVGLGKPKLCTKFKVHSFSHCVNIEVELQNFGELLQHLYRQLLLCKCLSISTDSLV